MQHLWGAGVQNLAECGTIRNLRAPNSPNFLPDRFDSLDRVIAMDWGRMIPGHLYAGGTSGARRPSRGSAGTTP